MIKLKTRDEFNNFIQSNDICLVKFGADWCGPCKALNKNLEDLKKDGFKYEIGECDVDDDEILEISNEFGVRNLPFLCVFNKGEIAATSQGAISANEIKNKVKSVQ